MTTVTTDQVRELRTEAGEAGDCAMVYICDRALHGDRNARDECDYVIASAAAMDDSV